MTDRDRSRAYACPDVEEVVAELGLGILSGIERADALAHLDRCPACRSLVEDMARVGDALVDLAPEAPPPVGFEARVLDRQRGEQRAAPGRRRWPAVAAVASVAAAVSVVVSLHVGSQRATSSAAGPGGSSVAKPGQVGALGARNVAVAALRHGDMRVGEVFAYTGSPSWVFMTVDDGEPSQQVTCQLETRGGRIVDLGTFGLSSGYRSWGATLGVDPATIKTVRLMSAQGQILSTATFAPDRLRP